MALGTRLGYIAFNMATSRPFKDVSEVKASLNWQGKRSEVREKSTLDRHSSVSVMTIFCYRCSLFFKGQRTGHWGIIQPKV